MPAGLALSATTFLGKLNLNVRIIVMEEKCKEKEEIQESNGLNPEEGAAFGISTSQKELLTNETPKKLLEAVIALPGRLAALKVGAPVAAASPSYKFRQYAEERDEISQSVPSSSGLNFKERISDVFAKKFTWNYMKKICIEYIKNPRHMALFVWTTCVAISGALLFLVMTGMLNSCIRRKSSRDVWYEVNNQILNALFTLICLYQHPKRIHHLILLFRWRPDDISHLRKYYCKHGTYKPHEWTHMMVVVLLLHLNCFAQYALCGLNLGYKRSERPAGAVGVCVAFSISSLAFAGVYTIVSPLGREYDSESDEESQTQIISAEANRSNSLRPKFLEKRFSFALRDILEQEQRTIEERPQWRGGIFDLWDDISVAYLSFFCTFCVFGWNMERLGFGNMYVHMATFILFCVSPFWVFNLAAVNVGRDFIRAGMGVIGVLLCWFGLLYGAFWRIQIRRRFKLPAYKYKFFCNNPEVADCALWLCCCWCSLAQEVRTGDFYDVVEDKLCRKVEVEVCEVRPGQVKPGPSSPPGNESGPMSPSRKLGEDGIMTPPTPSLIEREATS